MKTARCNCFVSILLFSTFLALCLCSFNTFNSLENDYLHQRFLKIVNPTKLITTQPRINDVVLDKTVDISSSPSPSHDIIVVEKGGDDHDPDEDEEEDEENISEESLPNLNDKLIPPSNVGAKGRKEWFKEKAPRVRILNSTPRTEKFDRRVLKFLEGQGTDGSRCEARIFLTWIAPASSFSKRYLLSLETIFKSHPKGCVVIVSPSLDSKDGLRILEPFLSRGLRVKPITADLTLLSKDTPAHAWVEGLKNGEVDPGQIPITQNLSNLLRLLLIYKYGGIYLDSDFVTIKDMSGLRNSIGIQRVNVTTNEMRDLNSALLIFDKEHPLVLKFIEEFATTFDGSWWGYNGPFLLTRVVQRELNNEPRLLDFTVWDKKAFYPVDWIEIKDFFDSNVNKTFVDKWLVKLEKDTYSIHLWNQLTKHLKIKRGSIIGKLFSDHCVICENIYDDDDDGPNTLNSRAQ